MIKPHEPALVSPVAPPLDLALIRKHTVSGPRYTSYPPATQFTTDQTALRLEEALAEDNAPGAGPLSLYFHLPFCETRCWFCGCTTVITQRRDAAAEYLDDIELELKLTAAKMDCTRPVAQLHLGGGTPTFLPPDQLRRLGTMIREYFHYAPDAEVSVEVDPRRLTHDHVKALRELGCNRASLGVQDTDPRVQLAVHRLQPHKQNWQAVEWLRAEGFRSINVDLIYGLPLQSAESFARTIDDVLELQPDRLSVFSYAHVPWVKPAQRILETRNELPTPAEKLAMFAIAHSKLTQAGFIDIGLDHFARPGDELAQARQAGTLHRNFQGYSTNSGASLYGFGMSAISNTANTYRQNFKSLPQYRAALADGKLPVENGLRLTAEDRRRRVIIMGIMCDRYLDFKELSQEIGVDFATTYATELASLADLEQDGLVVRTADRLEVTAVGAPLLRVIAMRFDAYLKPGTQRHSQSV